MAELTISGQAYKTSKMQIFKQFHVSRILAPIIFAGPKIVILSAFSRLSETDAEYIINSALDCVERKSEMVWARVGSLRAPMFEDMKMMDFYELAAAVITESLGGFFPALLSRITEAPDLKA